MNGSDYVEETCAEFYPVNHGDLVRTSNGAVVTLLQLDVSDHVIKRVLRHSTDDKDTHPWTISQFHFRSWKMYDQVGPGRPIAHTV